MSTDEARPRDAKVGRPPGLVVVLGVLGLAFFAVPLLGLLGRVPWSDLPELWSSDVVVDALRLSLVASVSSTLIALLLGLPLAWLLARVDFPGRSLVRGVVTLPLVLPPVVAGAALLFALGGLLFAWLVIAKFGFGVAMGDRPLLIISTLLMVLAVQIIAIGLVGELIIFMRGKQLRPYAVDEIVEQGAREEPAGEPSGRPPGRIARLRLSAALPQQRLP